MRILVIEDSPEDQQIVKSWLPDDECVFTANPLETYSLLLRDNNFDCCLCDYHLPLTVDGKFVRSLHENTTFPVIVFSGIPNEIATVAKERHAIIRALEGVRNGRRKKAKV